MSESTQTPINITEDGKVTKIILVEGDGETPTKGQEVKVTYKGTLEDGTEFDSSLDKESPFSFTLGKGNVIKAWDQGVATMKIGEKAILTCDPDYAYGEDGAPPKIPPNATLKFEIELLDCVDKEKSYWDCTDDERLKYAEQFKAEGNELLKAGQYDQAIKLYEKTIDYSRIKEGREQAARMTHDCHLNIALAYTKQKNYEKAIESATKGLDMAQYDIKGHYRRAMAYFYNDQFAEAKEDLAKALAIDPNNVDIKQAIAKVTAEEQRLARKEKQQWGKLFKQDYYSEELRKNDLASKNDHDFEAQNGDDLEAKDGDDLEAKNDNDQAIPKGDEQQTPEREDSETRKEE